MTGGGRRKRHPYMSMLPILDHDVDEPPVFTPEGLLEAVREERLRGEQSVPAVCVLDFDGDLTDWLKQGVRASRCADWACFHTEMSVLDVAGQRCGIIPRTIGGPYAVLIAEQLAASGARVIVGLTSSGRVAPALPIPSIVVATAAIRDEGASYHYLPPGDVVDAPEGLPETLANELKQLRTPVRLGCVWTTDAPYRETASQLDKHARAGALAVEMQAASLFAFAAARQVAVGVVAHVTNAVDHEGKDFDKGTEADELRLLEMIVRAGYRFLV